jgi:tRNA-dihydrouridine synthase B
MDIRQLTTGTVWLAPLAGFTDVPFRTICKESGADVMITEMTSADGIVYDYDKSIEYASFRDYERPLGIQIFGSKPDLMAKAVEVLLPLKPDFFNINMGCPVKKVVKRNAGSALMNEPSLAVDIVKSIKKTLSGTDIPLSVKIRSGWEQQSINAVEFSCLLEDAGMDFIIVHPRTRSQMYSGLSDWQIIKAIKDKVSMPVVGNGDIRSVEDGMRMYSETGCDAIMIGRGALGHPWIFAELKSYLLTKADKKLDCQKRYEIIERHIELTIASKGLQRGIIEIRAHLCFYTKGLRGGCSVRSRIMRCVDKQQVLELVKKLYDEQGC